MRRVTRHLFGVLAAVLLCGGGVAHAQERATLSGRVVDAASGEPVAAAEVAVEGPLARRVLTDDGGHWRIGDLPPGTYRVEVQRLGYASEDRSLEIGAAAPAELVVALTPAPLALDEIVVTAARRPQLLAETVVPTRLVTREQIEQSGAPDAAAVLVEQTGIQLEGGTPAGAGVMLQGLGAQRVLVLLDGQPLVGRVAGHFDLSRIPAGILERIEIVEGPQSTLYGSDAMGGVVNLVTRAPTDEPLTLDAAVVGGSQGRRDVDAAARGTTAGFGYALQGGVHAVDLAPGIAGDEATLADRWDGTARVNWRASPELAFDAGGLVVAERQRYRTGQLFRFADNEQWSARLGATWTRGAHSFAPLLYYSRFDHLSRAALGDQPVTEEGERDVQQLAELELVYSGLLAGATVDGGVELRREWIEADRVEGGDRTSETVEPFVQAGWTFGPATVVPGGRLAWSEQWGTTFTPRVATLVRLDGGLALRGSVGRGFRAPDFKELYLDFVNVPAGYAVNGNPDLRPERSTSYALDAEWAAGAAFGRVGAFHTEFRDFIETGEQDATGTFTYDNLASGHTRGVEVEGGVAWQSLRAEAGYALLDTRDDATGGPLLGRAEHSARVSLAGRLPHDFDASLTGLYTGPTPIARDADGRVSDERDSFLRLDARVSRALPGSLEVAAGVENLLDAEPGSDWPGFTGRRVYGGVTWRYAPVAEAAREDATSEN